MRLIDALCEKCSHRNVCKFRENEVVECSHFIDPEELRPKGRWEIVTDDYDNEMMRCSVCRAEFYDGENDTVDCMHNYCPNCGAKMEGGEQDAPN